MRRDIGLLTKVISHQERVFVIGVPLLVVSVPMFNIEKFSESITSKHLPVHKQTVILV